MMATISRAASALFERKNRREVDSRQAAFEVFHKALLDDIGGRDVDLARVEDALPILGKTIEDFVADGEVMQKRTSDAKFIATESQLRKTNAAATAKRDQLVAELDELVAKMRTQIAAESEVIESTALQILEIGNAKSRLVASCFDPDLIEQHEAANARRMTVGRTIYELQDPHAEAEKEFIYAKERLRQAEEAHGVYRDILAGAGSPSHNKQLAEAQQYYDSRKRRFDDLDAKLSQAKQERSEVEADIRRIQDEMLRP